MLNKYTVSFLLCLTLCASALSFSSLASDDFSTSAEALAAAKSALESRNQSQKCIDDVIRRNDANNTRRLQDIAKIREAYEEKEKVMGELSRGFYCSKCKRTQSEIEKQEKKSFLAHIREVQGKVVPAPQEVIEAKKKEYDDKIAGMHKALQNDTVYAGLKKEYDSCVADWYAANAKYVGALNAGNQLKAQESWARIREQWAESEAQRAERQKRQYEAMEKYREAINEYREKERAVLEARIQKQAEAELKKLEEAERQAEARRREAEKEYAKVDPDGPDVVNTMSGIKSPDEPKTGEPPTPLPNNDSFWTEHILAPLDDLKKRDEKKTSETVEAVENAYRQLTPDERSPEWEIITYPGGKRSDFQTGRTIEDGVNKGVPSYIDFDTGETRYNNPPPSSGSNGGTNTSPNSSGNSRLVLVCGGGASLNQQNAALQAFALCQSRGAKNCTMVITRQVLPAKFGAAVCNTKDGGFFYQYDAPTLADAMLRALTPCGGVANNCSVDGTTFAKGWIVIYAGSKMTP